LTRWQGQGPAGARGGLTLPSLEGRKYRHVHPNRLASFEPLALAAPGRGAAARTERCGRLPGRLRAPHRQLRLPSAGRVLSARAGRVRRFHVAALHARKVPEQGPRPGSDAVRGGTLDAGHGLVLQRRAFGVGGLQRDAPAAAGRSRIGSLGTSAVCRAGFPDAGRARPLHARRRRDRAPDAPPGLGLRGLASRPGGRPATHPDVGGRDSGRD
jgi:hypothetical protein